MTMNIAPVFERLPRFARGALSAANTNRDGTGTIVTIFTAGNDGSRIRKITITALSTTTAGMVRLYIYDGTNYALWKEIPVTAITPSGTVQAFQEVIEMFDEEALQLPALHSLRGSTHNAENFHVAVEGGDY